MELYLFRPEEHQRLYGCSNITVEDVPLEKRQHVVEGVIIIALTVIYYYFTNIHTAYDGSFSVGIPTLYIIFTILFFAKSHRMKGSKTVSKKQKMMLLQVFIISMLNFAAVSIYVYMMYFVPNMFLMHFAQFCWFHIHGFPPVIYLTFNASIRGDAINMFKNIGRKFKGQETKELATTLTKIEPSNTDSML
uniref:Uncharacterized protein n=1 Tax=Ditylenchus dipsaci TaxID=166011 RepID=A0A915E485_9BILA